ncbi:MULTISPECIES: DUF5403 family protein [unclassified Pseudoclavibacter]|uniref:DUF5403 family protein n=1 Tax=unclassified Pseudoclavibacter TaxID=2615177 RepID=UPI001BAD49EF|nr:DUF5403 family protein [Pseudoclavibacter sp. Marseille-Q4354]MBS3177751.1 DUF5403 family protein [Pseudoclavibacter sp. Marseille-Q4354]
MAEVFKNANAIAAQIAGESREMDLAAAEVAASAKAGAAAHNLAGHIHIEVAGRGKDRLIVFEHPQAGPIEFGHLHNNFEPGPVSPGAKWVRGLWFMRRAAQKHGSG